MIKKTKSFLACEGMSLVWEVFESVCQLLITTQLYHHKIFLYYYFARIQIILEVIFLLSSHSICNVPSWIQWNLAEFIAWQERDIPTFSFGIVTIVPTLKHLKLHSPPASNYHQTWWYLAKCHQIWRKI